MHKRGLCRRAVLCGWLDVCLSVRHISRVQNIPTCICLRDSARDPVGGAYSALPNPLAGFAGAASWLGGKGGVERGRGRGGVGG